MSPEAEHKTADIFLLFNLLIFTACQAIPQNEPKRPAIPPPPRTSTLQLPQPFPTIDSTTIVPDNIILLEPSPEPASTLDANLSRGSTDTDIITPNPRRHIFEETPTPEVKTIVHPGDVIYSLKNHPGKFALTMDDDGSPQILASTLDILDSLNVRATFFIPTQMVENYPDLMKRLAQKHSLGPHGYTHTSFAKTASLDEGVALFAKMLEATDRINQHKTQFVRLPYGAFGDAQHKEWLTQVIGPKFGIVFIQWSGSLDDSVSTTNRLWELNQMQNLTSGTILLSHWWSGVTRQTLPDLIRSARNKGLESAPIDDLLIVQ